jgi:hypothetical protein
VNGLPAVSLDIGPLILTLNWFAGSAALLRAVLDTGLDRTAVVFLIDKISRACPIGTLDLSHGLFHQQGVLAWHSVFTAVYAVHSLLRWKVGPAGNHAATLRKGIWLARRHELELATDQLLEKQARKQAANRQAWHRAKARKLELQASILSCDSCGQVYSSSAAHNCSLN